MDNKPTTNDVSANSSVNSSVVPVPILPRCRYRYKECSNPCTFRKGTSEFHSLCEYHRTKQNESQKRSDARRKEQISARRKEKRRQARAARARSDSAPLPNARQDDTFTASPISSTQSTYSPSAGFSFMPRGRVDRIFDILNQEGDND